MPPLLWDKPKAHIPPETMGAVLSSLQPTVQARLIHNYKLSICLQPCRIRVLLWGGATTIPQLVRAVAPHQTVISSCDLLVWSSGPSALLSGSSPKARLIWDTRLRLATSLALILHTKMWMESARDPYVTPFVELKISLAVSGQFTGIN